MEPLPRGANFMRGKTLWEIALQIAGNPETPYGGNRDLCVVVGSGSGESFTPWLRMATGAAILAHAVARGDVEMAFVNPSGLLTQAYRGVGLFAEPLPVRVVASYPSWDRFVCALRPNLGFATLGATLAARQPLRLSMREDPTHSTRVLVNQIFAAHGVTIDEVLGWGSSLQLNGGPGDERRLHALSAGEVDVVLDEGIRTWLPQALAAGYQLAELDAPVMSQMEALGWRQAIIPAGRYPGLDHDHSCIDFSGWPLYTRESLPDDVAYQVVDALAARADFVPWDQPVFTRVEDLGSDLEATPLDVPLHPGAARWYREHGANV
ncbi:MAG: hypothetical protein QOF51_1089 [Chloroflexota bacterium]|jgi:TRAP-type uncharacterized transport system substrate-binding protein|nr:hypothetical protein [Chloroflexota bacterium]